MTNRRRHDLRSTRRVAAVVASAIAALAFLVPTAATASAAPSPSPSEGTNIPAPIPIPPILHKYWAFGDSYSSGYDIPGYIDNSSCSRSSKSYPYVYAHEVVPSFASYFYACQGYTIAQVSAQIPSAIDGHHGLITLTAGGNDVHFSTLAGCTVYEEQPACDDALDYANHVASYDLQGRYRALFADLHHAYPNALIVVLNYPLLYEPDRCLFKSDYKQALYGLQKNINNQEFLAAKYADSLYQNVYYIDVTRLFHGHGRCDPTNTWFGLRYHPTATGARAIADALKSNSYIRAHQ